MKYIKSLLILFILLNAVSPLSAKENATAAKIKAAYINKFSHFIQWPESAVLDEESLTICVLGLEDVYSALQPLTRFAEKNRSVKLRDISGFDEIDNCKMLYIAKSESAGLKKILKYTDKKPIVTISSIKGFARSGGMIGFILVDSKVRLEINPNVAGNSGLLISARLLEVSRLIGSDDTKEADE